MSNTGNTHRNLENQKRTTTTTRNTTTTQRTSTGGAIGGSANNNLGGCISRAWPFLLLFFLLMLLLFLFKGFKGCNSDVASTNNKTETTAAITHSNTTTDLNEATAEDLNNASASSEDDATYDYTDDSSSSSTSSSSSSSGSSEMSGSVGGSSSSSSKKKSKRKGANKKAYKGKGTIIHEITDYLKSDRPLPKKFTLGTVGYDENSPMINTNASPEINQLTILLTKYYPFAKFKIHGHIDRKENEAVTGRFQCSQQSTLSSTRANCLFCNFHKRGVGQWRMELEGHGSSDPLVNYSSNKNRRVEIEILTRD